MAGWPSGGGGVAVSGVAVSGGGVASDGGGVSVGGGAVSVGGVAGAGVSLGPLPPTAVSLLRSPHAASNAAAAHRGSRNFMFISAPMVVASTRTVRAVHGTHSQVTWAHSTHDVRRHDRVILHSRLHRLRTGIAIFVNRAAWLSIPELEMPMRPAACAEAAANRWHADCLS